MSGIEWTQKTWNPIRGCSRISDGCVNCYAEKMAVRMKNTHYKGLVQSTSKGPRWTGEIMHVESVLSDPYKWKKPSLVFVNSMSDMFHEKADMDFVEKCFDVMNGNPRHTFQVLTKRADRIQEFIKHSNYKAFPSNVWIGVSVENQQAVKRIGYLVDVPAKIRFLSVEPMLGPVQIEKYLDQIEWVIIGGESGPNARPCKASWKEHLIMQCDLYNVPVFMKQFGTNASYDDGTFKGNNFDEWPSQFQRRDYPRLYAA